MGSNYRGDLYPLSPLLYMYFGNFDEYCIHLGGVTESGKKGRVVGEGEKELDTMVVLASTIIVNISVMVSCY